MDGSSFDTLTRSLRTARSRRGALATLLGGTLGLRGLAHPDNSAAGGTCKPACPECKQCQKGKHGKKGKCKPKREGTACAGGTCQAGVCLASSAPAPLPPPFCAGKNYCVTPAFCQASGPTTCACHMRAEPGHIGEPVCVLPTVTATNCLACTSSEVCVMFGGACAGGFGCVKPCPNPL